MADKPESVIEGEVLSVTEMQARATQLESELMQVPAFVQYAEMQRELNNRMASLRERVEGVMVPAYQQGVVPKTIKGDGYSVTVTESDQFDIDEAELPPKFWKKVPDTTRIRDTFHLTGKAPKGTKPFKKYGIQLRFPK